MKRSGRRPGELHLSRSAFSASSACVTGRSKKPHTHWSRIADVLRRRQVWFEGHLNLDPACLAIID